MRLEQGSPLPERRIDSVSADRMKAMAVLLEDPNPIHLDPDAARSLGLGDRVVNQGPANFAYVLNVLLGAAASARVVSVDVRYVGTVLAGDTVVAGGRVEEVEPQEDGSSLVDVSVWLDVEGGGRAVEGTGRLLLAAE